MTLSVEISSVLYSQLGQFARVADVTVEEFMLLATAEKIAAMQHHQWLIRGKPTDEVNPCGQE